MIDPGKGTRRNRQDLIRSCRGEGRRVNTSIDNSFSLLNAMHAILPQLRHPCDVMEGDCDISPDQSEDYDVMG